MLVYKSDGTYEEYSVLKIKKGICDAYNEINEVCPEAFLDSLINNLFIYDKISSSEIRRQVEEALMSINKKVARTYISKFKEIDENGKELKRKDEFVRDYINASNASTGSKYDSNANVSHKNVVTMGQELYKLNNIRQNRYMIQQKLSSMYSKKIAKQYSEDIDSHILYKHDESGTPGIAYCVSITMYPFLTDGLRKIGGVSVAPTDLKSFCGEFINLVYSVSSQFMGAVATPEFLMYMDYFIRKDYGDNYLERLGDVVEFNVKHRTLEKVIENSFQQIIHSMNMPAGNRGYQTVFWNVGYFDENYFIGVFDGFYFPDGTKPVWNTLSWLQKKFMKWFNEERKKYVLTFPVETMALLTDGEDVIDKEYADFTSEMWANGHSFFCYLSDSPDSLSSCCFSKDQKTLTKSSNGVNYMTFEELYNSKYVETKRNFTIYHNGSWASGKCVKVDKREMYKIETSNNKEIIVSEDHINPTLEGDKKTNILTTDDYLLFNTNKLDTYSERDEKLTYEQGYVIGLFIGDGSFGSGEEGEIYEINFSINEEKYNKSNDIINKVNKELGGNSTTRLHIHDKLYATRISSQVLVNFIIKWTNWKRGTKSFNKQLNLDALLQSYEFRKGILDGWYTSDGGNSNRCYTTSTILVEHMEVLITSLGLSSVINISDRRDEKCIIKNVEYDRHYPLYCVRWYDNKNKRSMDNVFIFKNNSIYFKIKSIEKIVYTDDSIYCFEMDNEKEPYFTLPNGIITHNCRLRNTLSDSADEIHNNNTHQFSMGTTSIATGSKSVMTLNLNRIIQDVAIKCAKEYNIPLNKGEQIDYNTIMLASKLSSQNNFDDIAKNYIEEILSRVYKYQTAFNNILKDFYNANMLDIYSAGFIDMKKQYLTIGVNGLTDAAEFLKIEIGNNETYKHFVNLILETININNRKNKTKELMFNTEFVPGENLSAKNYNWDKKDGYYVSDKHIMYSSYFFNPEDDKLNIIDKFKLHGKDFVQYLDGGQALHMNLSHHASFEQYRELLKIATKEGTNYFTFNIKNTVCNKCGHIDKNTLTECPKCGSDNLDYLTRVIGYLKRVSSFSECRQTEEHIRFYDRKNDK
jgi:anaerobic ribonucleoside-triphosphate reductase